MDILTELYVFIHIHFYFVIYKNLFLFIYLTLFFQSSICLVKTLAFAPPLPSHSNWHSYVIRVFWKRLNRVYHVAYLTFVLFVLQATGCLYDHIRWGEAFVIVYSICDMNSFNEAHTLLDKLSKLKLPSYYTTLLLGNKRDLDHSRWVSKPCKLQSLYPVSRVPCPVSRKVFSNIV